MEETVRSGCAHSWKNAKDKRKAWARSRDSWQNSEANDSCLVTETMEDNCPSNLERSRTSTEENGISNKKIEIWLQDCGGPLGASLDEQRHLFKGAVTKNGCSFEDDLSLGAEANYLHPHSNSMLTPSGTPAQVKRNQFYQMGNSMNSSGSGKSNTTVSSVSELLDLYEEDPEDVLYNLGFGTEEPDLASKIPCRFFNALSFAKGIDFKLFLDAQMQRMELDNPNFALTSRFRQIKVLTTVANVFSSLYSQVSGAPIKRIGSVSEAPTAGQGNTVGNNTGRLKKTVSKLNLFGGQQIKTIDTTSQTVPAATENSKTMQHSFDTNKDITDAEKKEEAKQKKETRLQKWRKLTDPSLKPVTEEVMTGCECPFYPSEFISPEPASNVTNDCVESKNNDAPYNKERTENRLDDISDVSDSARNLNAFTEVEHPAIGEQTSASSQENAVIECTPPACSTPEKGHSAAMQHPLISSLMEQKEFSFDLEEVQSNEGEGPNVPATRNHVPHARISATNKEHFTRTSSSHSDSSGFAEDPSSDMTGHSQGPDGYLQAMGSSADSCDSETTVTSLMDDLKTPLSGDQKFFSPFQTPVEDLTLDLKETMLDLNVELISNTAIDSSEHQGAVEMDCESGTGQDGSIQSADQTVLGIIDGEVKLYPESDLKCESEEDILMYSVHCGPGQRRKSMDSILRWHSRPDNATSKAMDFSSSSSIDKVTTVLERAKTQTYSVSVTSGRSRRPMTKANDRIMREGEMASKNDSTAELRQSSFQRSSSLPTKLLNPVRVVSSLNVQLIPDSSTKGSLPSFTYKYSAQKEGEFPSDDENEQSVCRSMLFIPSGKKERSRKQLTLNKQEEAPRRFGSQPFPVSSHLTQSCCSLHTLPSDWQDQTHLRTRSMCSIPNLMEPTCASTFGYAYPQRPIAHPYRHSPINPPSAIESQLCRVLTEIRSTVQNLSQIPMYQGTELSFPYYPSARSGLLPIYESTYQELQIMRRNLNFFRTQMMDLEFMILRQQTIVYRHLTDEERQEADQLQNLRNCVRMELQELELQLEERSFILEEQLKAPSQCAAFRIPSRAETFANNTDAMSSSSLNVMEPVSELLREQSCLRSELGLSEHLGEDYDYPHSFCGPYTNLESCSRSSSPGWMSRCSAPGSLSHGPPSIPSTTAPHDKPVNQATSTPLQSRQVYRSSVLLTPSPPTRAAQGESFTENKSPSGILDQNPIIQTLEPPEAEEASPSKGARSHIVEHPAFHDVLQEIKESIIGEIKREIMGGLLAAISPSGKDVGHKEE